jgi:hypothetical protein
MSNLALGWPANGLVVQWDATHQGSNPSARTFFWIYSGIFWCHALSGKRRSHRRRGTSVQESLDLPVLSPLEVLIGGRVCIRVFIGVSVCARCERLRCTV